MLVSKDGKSKAIEQVSFPMSADHLNEGLWDPGELIGGVTRATLEQRVKDFYLPPRGDGIVVTNLRPFGAPVGIP